MPSNTNWLAVEEAMSMTIDALRVVSKRTHPAWSDMIAHILSSQGRICVCGIGKSAFVAQKLTATFNSTGTPSYFMHAAEALHGDLGMIAKGDTIIAISRSGEGAELKAWLPKLLEEQANKLIVIVGNSASSLAQMGDWVLDASVAKESCPLGLAPTTSIMAQMLLSDSLAISVMIERGFNTADFARTHPGGILGKQTSLTCRHLVSSRTTSTRVSKNANLTETITAISGGLVGAAAVLDDKRNVLGIITDGDLRRRMNNCKDFTLIKAGDIMHSPAVTASDDMLAINALRLLQEKNINQLILLDASQKYSGMIHIHDILREGFVL